MHEVMLMLSEILSRKECSECKICCEFDDNDLWETPIIYNDCIENVLSVNPSQQFIENELYGNKFKVLKLNKENEIYPCTMLDRSRGCMLEPENKPFDCKIWPLRVMKKDGKTVIALSPVCPVTAKKPIDKIMRTAKELADVIFSQAKLHPEIIKDYIDGYKVLIEE